MPRVPVTIETLDGLSDTVITCLRRDVPRKADSDGALLNEVFAKIKSLTWSPARIRTITFRRGFPGKLASTGLSKSWAREHGGSL